MPACLYELRVAKAEKVTSTFFLSWKAEKVTSTFFSKAEKVKS
jgi:hypothetical protein